MMMPMEYEMADLEAPQIKESGTEEKSVSFSVLHISGGKTWTQIIVIQQKHS